MFIINRFNATTTTPVVATNDAAATTGNQSPIWGGINPSGTTGATGNAAAGNGLTNIIKPNVYVDQVIAKLVAIKIEATLTAGNDNYVRVPFSTIGIPKSRAVVGVSIVGVYDPNSNEAAPTPTPSLVTVTTQAYISVVKDALDLRLLTANLALFQGKVVNILVMYN